MKRSLWLLMLFLLAGHVPAASADSACEGRFLAIFSLPVEQYPDLAPPNVRVTANYPGASAQTLENTVTQVIEQNMTGLDNLMYMSSQSSGHRPRLAGSGKRRQHWTD